MIISTCFDPDENDNDAKENIFKCLCRFLQDPKHTLVHYVLFMDMVGRGEWIRPLQREFLFVLLQDSVQSIIYWMQSTKIHARRKYCKEVYIE